MAVFTPKRLSGPSYLTTSAVSRYTTPAGRTAVIKQVILNNNSGANSTVTLHVLTPSATAAASNAIANLTIAPNSQVIFSADIPLDATESLAALASTSSAVTITVTGIEIA